MIFFSEVWRHTHDKTNQEMMDDLNGGGEQWVRLGVAGG